MDITNFDLYNRIKTEKKQMIHFQDKYNILHYSVKAYYIYYYIVMTNTYMHILQITYSKIIRNKNIK